MDLIGVFRVGTAAMSAVKAGDKAVPVLKKVYKPIIALFISGASEAALEDIAERVIDKFEVK